MPNRQLAIIWTNVGLVYSTDAYLQKKYSPDEMDTKEKVCCIFKYVKSDKNYSTYVIEDV